MNTTVAPFSRAFTKNDVYIYNTTHDGNAVENSTFLQNSTTVIVEESENRLAVGIALAISGNIMISLALSVQKYAHNRLGDEGRYCLDKRWWLGMIMMGIGEFGNFMAYGFAPASLVAPLGSVAVLSNVIIAFIFLREPVTSHSIVGVSFVIIGSIFLISFSALSHVRLDAATVYRYLKAWTFLLYIGIELIALGILLYLYFVRQIHHLLILLLIVAIVASCTVISAKAVSTFLSEALQVGIVKILNPVFWIMLLLLPITTAIQIRFLNRAMQLYNVSDVVPVNFIFFTVSAILAGSIFYQEFYGVPFLRIFMFLFGCLLSFIGVYIISHKDKHFPRCGCLKKQDDTVTILEDKDAISESTIEAVTNDIGNGEKDTRNQELVLVSRLANLLKQGETVAKVQPADVKKVTLE